MSNQRRNKGDRWIKLLTFVRRKGWSLTGANLRWANLTGVDLSWANLTGADLTGANGILSPSEWLRANFKRDPETGCYVVYKARETSYISPPDWKWEPGAVLREVCNPTRSDDCGCGVNFGTLAYVRCEYPSSPIWACYLTGVPVVPFHTDGEARSDELTLIGEVENE